MTLNIPVIKVQQHLFEVFRIRLSLGWFLRVIFLLPSLTSQGKFVFLAEVCAIV